MNASTTKCLSLAVLLLTSIAAYAQAPSGAYIDPLSTGTNVKINTSANLSSSFGTSGMTLTVTSNPGSEWYWSDGGNVSYSDSNNLAFSLNPTADQDILTIDVTSLTLASGSLQVGAFFFDGTTLLTNELGKSNGGLNITTPGVYTLNMDTLADSNPALSTATAWKADFFFSGSASGSATISELEAGTLAVAPEPSTYLLMGIGVFALFAIRKFRSVSAL